ncbi:MAG: DUF1489 family protein [Methylobacteriaceae bacterium]|nr:DUF1489 family protein [Methylobacteriaceae bacterium]MBV9218872.1 DUF1489 family protein [Methylobacteriaceae bacterium]MBV9246536.1 DUF1489 family protein [Methylobacteriaceae bacterium]
MALHLLKLCVGADSVRDLEEWIAERLAEKRRRGETPEHAHVTRMAPKRRDELIDGGSLYWVIKGQVAARQKLLDVRPFTDGDGIGRCRLVLEPVVVPVMPRPWRPFQGWRYLPGKEAPSDISAATGEIAQMPEILRRELRELGLL